MILYSYVTEFFKAFHLSYLLFCYKLHMNESISIQINNYIIDVVFELNEKNC